MKAYLLLALCAAAGTGFLGFVLGDRRRRKAQGGTGPRPLGSIGEAVTQAERRQGFALVLFLGEDGESVRRAAELAEDPEVLRLLNREDVFHVVLRQSRQGQDLLETLFMKYAKEALTSLPAALLLDGEGKRLRAMHLEGAGPANQWLGEWLGTRRPPAP